MASNDDPTRDARVLLLTWVVLVSLTIGSYRLSSGMDGRIPGAAAWILGLATLKGILIASLFMEMRRGPVGWWLAMTGFLIVEATLIFAVLP